MGGCLTNLEDEMFNANFHDNDSTSNLMIINIFLAWWRSGTKYQDPDPSGALGLGTQDPWAQ